MFFYSLSAQEIKEYFWQILNHFGYSQKDIILVDKPINAKIMYVTPQNEMFLQKEFTSEYYLDLLDKNYPPKPLCEKKGIIYISRSKLRHYPKIAGEEYLETYFKKCGIRIVYMNRFR